MEMGDTCVMSCVFPDGHLHAVEKPDSRFLRISIVQAVAYVRVLLALLFSTRMTPVQCVCKESGWVGLCGRGCLLFLSSQPITVRSSSTALARQPWLLLTHSVLPSFYIRDDSALMLKESPCSG